MAIINHNSISGVTTVSVGSSIVVGDTFVITSNGLENITQISATGVITATSFSGALTGNVTGSATALSGTPDVTVGTLNATDAIISGDLTVQGTTTTLDTVVTEVDKLEVDANNTTVGVAITQSGTGDILRLYDGATQVVTVADGGRIGIGTEDPTAGTDGESDDLVIHRASGAAGMTIKTAANATGAIRFADPDGASQGRIEYNHTDNYFRWNTDGSERLRVTSTGKLEAYKGTSTTGKASGTEAFTVGNGAGNHRFAVYPDGTTVIGATGDIGNYNILLQNDGDAVFDGDVGIGLTIPTYKLQVAGTSSGSQFAIGDSSPRFVLDYRAPTSSTAAPTITSDGEGLYYYGKNGVNGQHIFYSGPSNTESLRIKSNGNIGIGTDNPEHKLEVKSGVNGTFFISGKSSTGVDIFKVYESSNGDGNNGMVYLQDGSGNTDVKLSTNGSSYFKGGNLGIGTDNPGAILEVAAAANAQRHLRVVTHNSGDSCLQSVYPSSGTLRTITLEGSTVDFYTGSGSDTTGTLRGRFNSSGSLGIGTDNAGTKLHVIGSIQAETYSASGNAWTYHKNADRTWINGIRGSNSDVYSIYDLTADLERLNINSSGAFGINGNNYGTSGQVLTSQGSSAAPQWATPSSAGVIQVKSTTKTNATSFTSSSSSFSSDVITVSITPTSSSNKILIIAHIHLSASATTRVAAKLTVGGSEIAAAKGDAAGSSTRSTITDTAGFSGNCIFPSSMTFLHSPGTTSALTYGIQISAEGNNTVYLNQPQSGNTTLDIYRPISTITVMEVTP